MRKDELDGFVQRNQKTVVGILASVAGAAVFAAGALVAPLLPGPVQPFAPSVAQTASQAVERKINQAAGGPDLCEEIRCTAKFGPAYTLPASDGGVCRCTSR